LELYLVQFKASRKNYFTNSENLPLKPGNFVLVQAERGEDLGQIVKRVDLDPKYLGEEKPPPILRLGTEEDLARLKVNREREAEALKECEKMIAARNLEMKLVGSEFQFDGNKVTFFFTSDKRVDFRDLVKELASVYRTRIELRQIGVRDEARRMGGFGCCGLQLCCTTFIKDFEPITTQLAKEQNLALNPAKLSGNCGRLLCCLLYEKEIYEKTLPLYPEIGSKFKSEKGEGTVEKINIFQEYMVIKHENGEEEKVTLSQIRKSQRKEHGFFKKKWQKLDA
jgi:cell fate regulator YaaT (PSP1 superfamily)